MKNNSFTIAHSLISEEDIRRKLPSIFTDSIILDSNFKMVVVSKNVLEMLEFRSFELQHKNINYISGSFDFSSFLTEALLNGFFQERYVELFSKSNRPVLTIVSGFYLGLISNINGYIILRLREAEEFQKVNKEIDAERIELDNFIYRTAHDLRGPLATMLGLINLYKMKNDEFEVDHLIKLIDHQASELDEKLFNLVYLAKADQSMRQLTHVLNVRCLEMHLRTIVEKNGFADILDFQVHASEDKIEGVNEELGTSLLENILHFILNLPKTDNKNHQIIFFISVADEVAEVKVIARGFGINEQSYNVIHHSNSVYGDMLTHPELVNYFAALKIALRLKASIYMNITNDADHEIITSLPLRSKIE